MHICAAMQSNADLIISHVIAHGEVGMLDERKGCRDALKHY